MLPSVTSPSSACRSPEMALSVVLFPAPFEPRSATIFPLGTWRESPFSTRITSS
jgi:hypothetical protein